MSVAFEQWRRGAGRARTYSAAARSSTSRSRPMPSRSARCKSTKPRRQLGSHCPATEDIATMMVAVNAKAAIASMSEKPATSVSGSPASFFCRLPPQTNSIDFQHCAGRRLHQHLDALRSPERVANRCRGADER